MATLATVTRESRILLKLLGAATVIIFVLFFFIKGADIFKKIFFPAPPAPPKEEFGKLPRILFPVQNTTKFDFQINTVSGTLPAFSDRVKIYKTKTNIPNVLALRNIREKMRSAEFLLGEQKLSDTTYQWSNKFGDTIRFDIYTNNFQINSDYLTNQSIIFQDVSVKKDSISRETSNLISRLGIDSTDINIDNPKITYLKIVDGKLLIAESQNQAQLIRVDYFQNDIQSDRGKQKIFYPQVENSTMYFIVGIIDDKLRTLEAKFDHSIIDLTSAGTYPIKTTTDAFEELKAGNAYIAQSSANQSIVDITDVSLQYYVGREAQSYLMPIYVFVGSGFTGYVQAIPDTSIQN